jgi:hypothetical protein
MIGNSILLIGKASLSYSGHGSFDLWCRFADRDMAIRYYWGWGVGHIYAHGKEDPDSSNNLGGPIPTTTITSGTEFEGGDPGDDAHPQDDAAGDEGDEQGDRYQGDEHSDEHSDGDEGDDQGDEDGVPSEDEEPEDGGNEYPIESEEEEDDYYDDEL